MVLERRPQGAVSHEVRRRGQCIVTLSPFLRLVIEIAVVLLFIFGTGWSINDFHGLWGIEAIPEYIAVPLTVLACVGIINSVNMIDGVDGLMSGYGIVVSIILTVFFYDAGDMGMSAMSAIAAGALIPFFLFNVVGSRSKMYLGDGGSLMIGTMMALFVVSILKQNSLCSLSVSGSFGLVPFTLALLAVPIFDTLRVMIRRIRNGRSPFSPDKNHLHHMFVDLGFSHLGTTLSVIFLDLAVVLAWMVSYLCGASIDMQLYVVLVAGFAVTFGLYKSVYLAHKGNWFFFKKVLMR